MLRPSPTGSGRIFMDDRSTPSGLRLRCSAGMPVVPALLVLAGGIVLVVAGAELFFAGVLGGTTFLALGVAGLAAVVAPIRARLPLAALARTAASPAAGGVRRRRETF